MEPLAGLRFSHLVVGVTDMDRALGFSRGLLGMDVVFDQAMSGEPFDHALGGSGEHRGRVVGGLVGGVLLELLSLGGGDGRPAPGSRPSLRAAEDHSPIRRSCCRACPNRRRG